MGFGIAILAILSTFIVIIFFSYISMFFHDFSVHIEYRFGNVAAKIFIALWFVVSVFIICILET